MPQLSSLGVEPFIVDIRQLSQDIQAFLQANILIINIPSKNLDDFRRLQSEIETSEVEEVLLVSSTSVYEDKNRTVFESNGDESTSSPLLAIENLFKSSSNVITTIVRFGGLIGYGRHPGKFFREGTLVHNPDSNVNLIHRDDCIGIISKIIEHDVWGEIFNCCADTHPTKREFYTRAAKAIGLPIPQFERTGVTSFKIVSNEKVKRSLNYEFLHPDLMKIELEKAT